MIQTTQEWFTPEERMPKNFYPVWVVLKDTDNPMEATYSLLKEGKWYINKYRISVPTSHIKLWSYPVAPKGEGK